MVEGGFELPPYELETTRLGLSLPVVLEASPLLPRRGGCEVVAVLEETVDGVTCLVLLPLTTASD